MFRNRNQSFLVGMLMADGISIDSMPINSRDPTQLRSILDGLASQSYDLIIFSPFSHARLPELEVLLSPTKSFRPKSELEALVSSVLSQADPIHARLFEQAIRMSDLYSQRSSDPSLSECRECSRSFDPDLPNGKIRAGPNQPIGCLAAWRHKTLPPFSIFLCLTKM